jgi:ATP-dependent helicase/nuclease subunit B
VLGDRKYIELFESLGKSHGIKDDYQAIISASLNTVKKYIQNMREGIFHPTVLIGKCPRYCDYKTVCRLDDQRILESLEAI